MGTFDKSLFHILQDYIAGGCKEELTEDEQTYLNALTLMLNMSRKYGKEGAVSFVRNEPFNVPYIRANEMYAEAVNLFYYDNKIERQAQRNMMADNLERSAEVVRRMSRSSKDMDVYNNMMKTVYLMRGLDKADPKPIDESKNTKPFKIYSLDPKSIGLPAADRNSLKERIKQMQLPAKEKNRIEQEAQIIGINFNQLYDYQEEKTSNQ